MKHLIPHFIAEKNNQGETWGKFQGFTLFLDMSGFTNLTQHLMEEEGNEGAEMMSQILNDLFAPLVNIVYRKGGFIPYFAGDAFTSIFIDNEDVIPAEELADTAKEIQRIYSGKNFVYNSKEFPIHLKIGLSYGEIEWGIIGKEHKGFYFKGQAIDACATAEQKAKEGDVIVDMNFIEQCTDPTSIFTCRKILENYYRIIDTDPGKSIKLRLSTPPVSQKEIRDFFPDAVIHYDDIGEFREVVSVFISFKGIENQDVFHEFAGIISEQFASFSGYFKEIDFGDKGGVMVGFFGVPLTYGDNVERALRFVTSLSSELAPVQKKSPLEYKVGITTGMAFTGIIGGKERCQYAVVGNNVNLAARLMVYADWGDVLVSSEISKEKGFQFKQKGDIQYKGIQGLISTHKFIGEAEKQSFYSGEMIGREKEMKNLLHFTQPILNDKFAGVGVIFGEAGIGKSRLAYEVKDKLLEQGAFNWYTCQADQILRKPFNPFIYHFRNYFQQSPDRSDDENTLFFEKVFQYLIYQCEEISSYKPELIEIIRNLKRTKTIIAARLGLYYKDSLWNQLDAKGRYQNTISAFINLLQAEAFIQPYVIEVEDGHWFDESTKALLSEMIKSLQDYPVCILITSRYEEVDNSKPNFFAEPISTEIPFLELDLNILSPDAIEEFAEKRLEGKINKEFKKLLLRTTNGNPFYTEQMLEYFAESGFLKKKDDTWFIKDKNVKISGSINAVLMARIDKLSSLVKETVKAAAVIGREFEVQILGEVMKKQRDFIKKNGNSKHLLKEQIDQAEKSQIWKAVNEIRYIFKHSLLREAVYDMQLRTRLRELHRLIAEAIEGLYDERIEERYADLAFHYGQADVREKIVEYLEKAGDYSKNNFQNQRAIQYYDELAERLNHITEQSEYVKTLLKKADILNLIGDWNECERVLQNALGLAGSSGDTLLLGRANNDLGSLLMLRGDYEQARKYLEIAAMFFEEIKDEIGTYRVYGNLGNLYFRQGEYEKAKDYYKESLRISDEIGHSNSNYGIVSYLGLALMNQGQYDEAIQQMLPQLEQCEATRNKQGIANISINLGIVYFEKGDTDEAMSCYQKGLKECEDLDNKFLTAIALGCLGKALAKKGYFDRAKELYDRDLKLCRELGDKQGLSITLGLMGDLLLEKGEFDEAIVHLDEQLRLAEELNYQKGIANALGSLGDTYFHQSEHKKALDTYRRGMKICEEIDNKRMLIMIVMRMVELALIMEKEPEEIRLYSKKADLLADDIGNQELIFMTSVKRAQVEIKHGHKQEALEVLMNLLETAPTPEEKSEVLFVLGTSPNVPESEKYRQEGRELFASLFEKTPKYDYSNKSKMLG